MTTRPLVYIITYDGAKCFAFFFAPLYEKDMNRLKKEVREFFTLMRSAPAAVVALFTISVFAMNLLANKSIDVKVEWLALDCGIIVSWIAFLAMDVLTKRFGPKAATEISLFAIIVNILFCLLFFIGAKLIPGVWGESDGSGQIDAALDGTFGGTWFIVLGSTVAFIASAVINNFLNFAVGKAFRKNRDGAAAFLISAYVSTAVGQFADNLVFSLLVSRIFFGWSLLQCLTCAATGMVAELLIEAAFSYFGYLICERWKRTGVGKEYFEFKKQNGAQHESDNNGFEQGDRQSDSL